MKTSYYSSPLLQPEMNLVRISTSAPRWFTLPLRTYPQLYPGWDLVGRYKAGMQSEVEARELYQSQVLAQLDPQNVWKRLGADAILLCWEKAGKFCHRRLVAHWLEERLGVTVEELGEGSKLF